MLLLALCALLVRHSVSLGLQGEPAALQTSDVSRRPHSGPRGLQEVFEDDEDAEEEPEDQPEVFGAGISRLGIHGEGWSHVELNLLESDGEVMALAAAIKGGDAVAEGRGAQSSVMPSEEAGETWRSSRLKKVTAAAEEAAHADRAQSGRLRLSLIPGHAHNSASVLHCFAQANSS